MTKLIASAIAVLLVALPASAHAANIDRRIPSKVRALIQSDLDRGDKYWGAAPRCRGGVTVSWSDKATNGSNAATLTHVGSPTGCQMYVSTYLVENEPPEGICRDLVHEWGHTLGHTHVPSGDPDNIMPYLSDPDGRVHINTAWVCFHHHKRKHRHAHVRNR